MSNFLRGVFMNIKLDSAPAIQQAEQLLRLRREKNGNWPRDKKHCESCGDRISEDHDLCGNCQALKRLGRLK